MKYNLKNDFEYEKLILRVKRDRELKNTVEYSKPNKKRSLSINAYLHVLIQYFAVEYGETTRYVKKEIYKDINRDIYYIEFKNKKQGYSRDELRSSADLTDAEMALSIERFKNYAAKEAGILLPSSDQKEFLEHCMSEIEKNKYYI
jgi:hypothetical protein